MKKEIKKKKKKNNIEWKWIIEITILSFTISLIFSALSESVIVNVNALLGIVILFVFIGIGILFDMIGVSVTTAQETPFHAMSARKVKGAKTAVKFKRNANKVSSFCNDVIGDICGIISGTVGATIALTLSSTFNIPIFICSLLTTAIVAALTIGGKAIFKGVAISKCDKILFAVAKIVETFKK